MLEFDIEEGTQLAAIVNAQETLFNFDYANTELQPLRSCSRIASTLTFIQHSRPVAIDHSTADCFVSLVSNKLIIYQSNSCWGLVKQHCKNLQTLL
jgi:hypothetical protein